ncbi:MAG TPA: hypothetical protein PKD00_09530 [Burkholderiales bacterium]|mgnify:CR=1 FL=1|nr:hypothetical protein [Burkholderiales bacterium]
MKIKQSSTITILGLIITNSFAISQIDLLNAQYNYQVVSKQNEQIKSKYLETENLAKQAESDLNIAQKNFQETQAQLKTIKQEFDKSQQKLNTAANSVDDVWNQLNHPNSTNINKP